MTLQAVLERALEEYQERLSALPNVVGLGIVDKPDSKELAVAVYVSQKVPLAQLARADRIPRRLSTLDGKKKKWVSVSVIEQGTVELE